MKIKRPLEQLVLTVVLCLKSLNNSCEALRGKVDTETAD